MLLITTSSGDDLLRNVNIDDLEWPLTPKIAGFSEFFLQFCVATRISRVNCAKMARDKPRQPANRNCYRLLRISWALAQIFCWSHFGSSNSAHPSCTTSVVFYSKFVTSSSTAHRIKMMTTAQCTVNKVYVNQLEWMVAVRPRPIAHTTCNCLIFQLTSELHNTNSDIWLRVVAIQ